VVDILLTAGGLVARRQKTTGRRREETGLQPGCLCVVVVAITIALRNMLENNTPVALHIYSSGDLDIDCFRRTQGAFRANPVCGVIRRIALRSSSVEGVVKRLLCCFCNTFYEIISRLVSFICILLQEERVLRDLLSNVIGRVVFIKYAIGQSFSFLG